MLKLIKLGGLAGVLLLFAPIAVNAQLESLEPTRQIIAQQEITSLEFNQYVQAIKQQQAIQREAQQMMVQAIEKEGLSPQRFQEIGESVLQRRGNAELDELVHAAEFLGQGRAGHDIANFPAGYMEGLTEGSAY